jgi:hypothetical protein
MTRNEGAQIKKPALESAGTDSNQKPALGKAPAGLKGFFLAGVGSERAA